MFPTTPGQIYHDPVQVDFAVELGRDDECLEFPWSGPEGEPRYYDLKRHPDLLAHVEEAAKTPELGEFLASVNAAVSLLETAKCDVWYSPELNPEEEILGSCKFGCYVDLLFSDPGKRFSFSDHELLAQKLSALLKHVPEIPASAEFLIRRCYYHADDGPSIREGFYITLYVFGFGEEEMQARQRWAIALKLVENAIRQVSATRR
jgi:hypothetical protein